MKDRASRFASVFISALIFAAATSLSGCKSLIESAVKEPKITFDSVKVRDPKKEGATAVIALNVQNPNGFEIVVDRLKYSLELDGKSISSSELHKVATIAAKATTKVEVPVPFRYDQVFSSIMDLLGKGSAPYKVKGDASVGPFTLPFDHTGDVKIRE